MCLSQASPLNRILACLDVRTTLSKKFNPATIYEMLCGILCWRKWRPRNTPHDAALPFHAVTNMCRGDGVTCASHST
jgi:hypothetical protein